MTIFIKMLAKYAMPPIRMLSAVRLLLIRKMSVKRKAIQAVEFDQMIMKVIKMEETRMDKIRVDKTRVDRIRVDKTRVVYEDYKVNRVTQEEC